MLAIIICVYISLIYQHLLGICTFMDSLRFGKKHVYLFYLVHVSVDSDYQQKMQGPDGGVVSLF